MTRQSDHRPAIQRSAAENVTMTSLPGAILGVMADVPGIGAHVASLRTIIYGGSPTPMGVLRKAGAALPPALSHAYGITETAGVVTNPKPREPFLGGSEEEMRRPAS